MPASKGHSPEEQALLLDYDAVLGAPSGRRVLAHIIFDLGRFDAVHDLYSIKDGVAGDRLEQRFQGRREAAVDLQGWLKEANHRGYQQLVRERLSAEEETLAFRQQSQSQSNPEE